MFRNANQATEAIEVFGTKVYGDGWGAKKAETVRLRIRKVRCGSALEKVVRAFAMRHCTLCEPFNLRLYVIRLFEREFRCSSGTAESQRIKSADEYPAQKVKMQKKKTTEWETRQSRTTTTTTTRNLIRNSDSGANKHSFS